MGLPALAIQRQGLNVVSADQYNTYEQTCDTVAQLRGFGPGIDSLEVMVRAYAAFGDGGAGPFVWNSSATSADDGGVTTIAPVGWTDIPGRWLRIGFLLAAGATLYLTPVSGFSVVVGPGVQTLILNPAATLAAGAITFPAVPVDGQVFRFSTSQTISSLALSTGVNGLHGGFAAISANTAAAWQFVAASVPPSWFRIQ